MLARRGRPAEAGLQDNIRRAAKPRLVHFVTAVLNDAELLDSCGSGVANPASFSVLWALTRFAMLPPAFAVTLTLTELRELLPTARSPSAQVIGPPRRGGVQVPFVVVTPRNDAPDGTGLLSTTLCAASGPTFETVITYVICALFFADVGPAMLTATSALGGGGGVVT